ncbi:hypothetical protein AXF42_Ash002850 [Apostasia shenzhenica]|uniref:Transcription repressor n=1 Tax=Apostasia shenzhenica TaxID=1088818 RepID=A0A2I0A7J9_9ASPA|nr:hypothetical protein AXF42_Ash002850 [Apostasia shenzhenica]
MIGGAEGRRGGRRMIILVAMGKRSYEPRRDFRESMMQVIVAKGLEEAEELRSLLNCYISVNPREQRQAILEAFHEVCSTLFSSSGRGGWL